MPVAESELFEEYAADFAKYAEDAAARLQEASQASEGRSAQSLVAEAAKLCSGADQALKQMEMEANSSPPATRSMLDPKVRERKALLADRRKAVEVARQEADRRALFSAGEGEGGTGKSARDRQRLLETEEKLNESTHRLEAARRQALETEQIGLDVMSDLRQQRDVIIRTHANVGEIGSQLGSARRLIDGMARRAAANRMLARGVMLFMLLMVAISGYFVLGGSAGGSSSKTPESEDATATVDAGGA